MNPSVNWFFEKNTKWTQEYQALRDIMHSSKLTEELKWGVPCYTINKKNVALIHGFKDYCALLFHKGSLLKDEAKILIQQTENVQVPRQIRFKNLAEIIELTSLIKSYLAEAIELEKAGVKAPLKTTAEFAMPDEFKAVLKENPKFEKAFYALTPGRQRGYLLHFSQAKQAATRVARIEKHFERIMDGKGLEDA